MADKTQNKVPQSTKTQRSNIYGLASYQTNLKEELVQWATNDNSKISTHDLTFGQANLIIEKMGGTAEKINANSWGRFNYKNAQHKKILSLCMDYGWRASHPKTGRPIADINKLGNWLQTDPRCPVKKPLKEMDTEELTTIIVMLSVTRMAKS